MGKNDMEKYVFAKNYLDDAMGINFTEKLTYKFCKECSKGKSKCPYKAMIDGKCYKDPDKVSHKLYKDMQEYYKEIFKGKEMYAKKQCGRIYLKPDDVYEHEFSVDYIGPSRSIAYKYLGEGKDEIIRDFLLETRTIGGHIFWPAHNTAGKTINTTRGLNGLYDRIDIALGELKHAYDKNFEKEGPALYSQKLYEAYVRYQWFFELFKSFPEYIEKMKLCNYVYNAEDNDYNVISLVISDLKEEGEGRKTLEEEFGQVPKKPLNNKSLLENYEKYINNCTILIKARTEEIKKDYLKRENSKNL